MGTREESAKIVETKGYSGPIVPLHAMLGTCVVCTREVWGSVPRNTDEYCRRIYVHYGCKR